MNATLALAFTLFAVALGLFSSTLFVWEWFIGGPTQLSASILLLAILAVFSRIFFSLRMRLPQSQEKSRQSWLIRIMPVVCVGVSAAYTTYALLEYVNSMRHGGWDAWAFWNMHARFMYRGGSGAWLGMLDRTVTNPDYPKLLPGLVSGMWTVAGAERPWMPAALAILFAVLSLGILSAAVSTLARDERGWLAGLLLLATPGYWFMPSAQGADIPLAMYVLVTVVLLAFAEAWPRARQPLLVLAGFSAGLGAWTKNEGLLFIVAVLAGQIVAFTVLRKWRSLVSSLVPFVLGLAPMLILVLAFKAALAPPNNPVATLEHVGSPERYGQILWGFYDEAKAFGGTWHSGGVHPFVLVGLFLLLYVSPIRKVTPGFLSLVLIIVFMLGGYFSVYLVSSFGSVRGYMGESLDRLWFQLWPACLFIVSIFSTATGGSKE